MRGVCVQSMHRRRSLQNDANPRVAMTVDAPLMTLGQAKPPLEIEVVLDLFKLALADEKAGEKARHHRGHLVVNRVFCTLESINQLFELLLPSGAGLVPRFEGGGNFLDVLDVFSDRLLLVPDVVQPSVDAIGQSAELLFCEPPFFSSKFRWIDARTSSSESAICRPGGWSGPP
jgi:hypothetical protein